MVGLVANIGRVLDTLRSLGRAEDRVEREASANKLTSNEIAHAIVSVLEMDDRGMIPELSVWATNPW